MSWRNARNHPVCHDPTSRETGNHSLRDYLLEFSLTSLLYWDDCLAEYQIFFKDIFDGTVVIGEYLTLSEMYGSSFLTATITSSRKEESSYYS